MNIYEIRVSTIHVRKCSLSKSLKIRNVYIRGQSTAVRGNQTLFRRGRSEVLFDQFTIGIHKSVGRFSVNNKG